MSDPIWDFQQAQAQAKAANEQRYQQILNIMQNQLAQATAQQAALRNSVVSGYKKRMADVLGTISNLGASQRNDIQQQYARASSQGLQNLVSRGLGNSTVLAALQRGYQADQSKAGTQLNDALSREQAGYQSQLSGDLLQAQQGLGTQGINLRNALQNQINDFMASRTDAYPDPNVYLALAQMAGRAGAGAPGGGGVGMPMSNGGMPKTTDFGFPTPDYFAGGGGGYGGGYGSGGMVGQPAYGYTSYDGGGYGATDIASALGQANPLGILASLYASPILNSGADYVSSPFLGAGAGASASLSDQGSYYPWQNSWLGAYTAPSSASAVSGAAGAGVGGAGGFGSLGE